ncbi:hypothetical protein HK405_006083 [Cladochytrium tenue]|nr:hypothetical protein HK405_006083 [Cladochytrium tenue]
MLAPTVHVTRAGRAAAVARTRLLALTSQSLLPRLPSYLRNAGTTPIPAATLFMSSSLSDATFSSYPAAAANAPSLSSVSGTAAQLAPSSCSTSKPPSMSEAAANALKSRVGFLKAGWTCVVDDDN